MLTIVWTGRTDARASRCSATHCRGLVSNTPGVNSTLGGTCSACSPASMTLRPVIPRQRLLISTKVRAGNRGDGIRRWCRYLLNEPENRENPKNREKGNAMELSELFAASLSRMTDVELRETTVTALVEDLADQGGQKMIVCTAEAQRRGKACIRQHAYVEIQWGPDVADQMQAQCCISLARGQAA